MAQISTVTCGYVIVDIQFQLLAIDRSDFKKMFQLLTPDDSDFKKKLKIGLFNTLQTGNHDLTCAYANHIYEYRWDNWPDSWILMREAYKWDIIHWYSWKMWIFMNIYFSWSLI